MKSLGHVFLVGALDVVDAREAISVEVRSRYLPVFLWAGFLMIAKIRKSAVYVPKTWINLSTAQLSNTYDDSGMSISYLDHSLGSSSNSE